MNNEIAKSSALRQGAFVLLLAGAMPGFVDVLSLLGKIWQGSRVEVDGPCT